MELVELIAQQDVLPSLTATDKVEALREMAGILARNHSGIEESKLTALLLERERLGSTGVGEGVAIPHCKVPGIQSMVGLFGRSTVGVEFDAVDNAPVFVFFVMVVPEDGSNDYLRVLAKISTLCRNAEFRKAVRSAPQNASAEDLYSLLTSFNGG